MLFLLKDLSTSSITDWALSVFQLDVFFFSHGAKRVNQAQPVDDNNFKKHLYGRLTGAQGLW